MIRLIAIGAFLSAGGGVAAFAAGDSAPPASTNASIDQSRIDAALAKLRAREQSAAPTTRPVEIAPVAPDRHRAAVAVAVALAASEVDVYPHDVVLQRKLDLIHNYDQQIAQARFALRKHEGSATSVRQLLDEEDALAMLPLDQFRQLLLDTDAKNAQRIERYHAAFGSLDHAAATVVTILMKSGLIDSAQPLADDPLSEDLELSRGVRRAYFHFLLPAKTLAGAMPQHNGYIEFQLAAEQGLWLPTYADLQGDPFPLYDTDAFLPLRPYKIQFDGTSFVVAQESSERPALLTMLLARHLPLMMVNADR